MRPILTAAFLLILATSLRGQSTDSSSISTFTDSSMAPHRVEPVPQIGPADSSKYNRYGDLLEDDPAYNPRYPIWAPAARVFSADLFNWSVARFIYKYDWAKTGPRYWKINFQKGPEWDEDGFGINFIGHPHTGSFYYNVARSNGYSYWASLPFAIQGSLTWEYFGENTRPSYNDMINTPVSGMFLGEVFYRLSSNILDDRTRGGERVFREILAGIVNPTRALNRLTQGKMFRRTSTEVYQKEPLNITLSGGIHKVNNKVGKDL